MPDQIFVDRSTMTTQLPLNLVPKPPPYNDSSKPFPSFWRHVTRFLANSVTSSDQLIRIGTAFHLRNIAETKKLSDIDPARFHTPETNTIKYMQIVARTVHQNNPWAEACSIPQFLRAPPTTIDDDVSRAINRLTDDIKLHASYGILTEFVPSVKFEDGQEPTEALSAIKLYFRDFYTFDPTDLLALLSV